MKLLFINSHDGLSCNWKQKKVYFQICHPYHLMICPTLLQSYVLYLLCYPDLNHQTLHLRSNSCKSSLKVRHHLHPLVYFQLQFHGKLCYYQEMNLVAEYQLILKQMFLKKNLAYLFLLFLFHFVAQDSYYSYQYLY